jgi:hypothetical protein
MVLDDRFNLLSRLKLRLKAYMLVERLQAALYEYSMTFGDDGRTDYWRRKA